MAKRTYGQYCAVARALDVIGERWTVLVVRELLTGPKRFTDLLSGLDAIGPNLLTARLKQLEADGLIRKSTLPPPAASAVYELTEAGRALEPVLVELIRWGRRVMGPRLPDQALHPHWLPLVLKAAFQPEAARDVSETYELRAGGRAVQARVRDGQLSAGLDINDEPDLVLTADVATFFALIGGAVSAEAAARSGALTVEGSREALRRWTELFRLPRPDGEPGNAAVQ